MKKNCILCHKDFESKSNAQKSCRSCATNKCQNCGKEFNNKKINSKQKQTKYCNRKCFLAKRFNFCGKCKNCQKTTNKLYCSDSCRKKYWNKNGYKIHKKKYFWERKIALIKELGGKCCICGIDDFRLLDIDHIDRDKKNMFKNHQYTNFRRLKEWKENKLNLRLLCANCHRIRTWEQMNYGQFLT